MNKEHLIYIDWNLFSILKAPKLLPHIILKQFIEDNKDKITLVYSDAHLGDLGRTSKKAKVILTQDLSYLSEMTNHLTIVKYFGRNEVEVGYRNALEFFNTNKSDNESGILSFLQGAVKRMTNGYGHLRDDVIRKHLGADSKDICNYSVAELDALIKTTTVSGSLKELIEFGLNLRGDTSRNPITYFDYYVTAYNNLDLIGFFPDTMKQEDGFNNLLNDSKHSAYGSLCKAFITNDNKCYHKSKLLFEYYNSNANLIRTCKRKGDAEIGRLKNELNNLLETPVKLTTQGQFKLTIDAGAN
jgi:hypothetical protein